MCHSTDSRPPALDNFDNFLGSADLAERGTIPLISDDGTEFAAFRALPAKPGGADIVILPDVRGFHPYYEALLCHDRREES